MKKASNKKTQSVRVTENDPLSLLAPNKKIPLHNPLHDPLHGPVHVPIYDLLHAALHIRVFMNCSEAKSDVGHPPKPLVLTHN